ncbi:hypothetical protein [Klebsiella pneumoniae]
MFDYILKREGVFIAFLTFMLYTAVYFFERGSASELQIPLDLISISVTTISDDLIYCYLYLFPMLTISFAALYWGRKAEEKKAFSFLVIAFVYVLLSYLMIGTDKKTVLFSIFMSGILIHLVNRITPLKNTPKNPSKNDGAKYYLNQVIDVAAVLFFISFTFVGLGRGAVYKDEFKTFVMNGKEYAIVKVYGENMFVWQVTQGKAEGKLTYFRVENVSGVELIRKSLRSDHLRALR